MKRLAAALTLAATPLAAQDGGFVEANLLGIFYHELGHAVIDIEGVPIFAQEEDAADVFSIFLIDAYWEEDSAENMAYHAASGFWAEAMWRDQEGGHIAWWDSHSPDERRFFNTVCLFYGANPEARQEFAEEMNLPEERQDYCPQEYDLAAESWGGVMEAMIERGAGETFVLKGEDSLTLGLLKDGVAALNAEMSLARPLTIAVEHCGEANAFYDPEAVQVTMCLEFEAHLKGLEQILAR
ncbi:MAG: DUF4344 domain-containing metallopeptidase [Silicimonas sp.]|nr:DUF4344 domain-containing metallopeptidase [Silicimonas sp.]